MVASANQESASAADRVGEVDRVTNRSPAGWDDLTVNAPGGHVMQGTAWADHRRSQGARPRFVIFEDGSGALVTLRRSPLVPGTVASIRRGPAHGGLGLLVPLLAPPQSPDGLATRLYVSLSSIPNWRLTRNTDA